MSDAEARYQTELKGEFHQALKNLIFEYLSAAIDGDFIEYALAVELKDLIRDRIDSISPESQYLEERENP